jgi:hypothetical protein
VEIIVKDGPYPHRIVVTDEEAGRVRAEDEAYSRARKKRKAGAR